MTSYLSFARSEIPEDIRIPLMACLKEEWDWIFAGDECFWDILEKYNHPVSFVALENRLLVGYAEVTRRSLDYVDGRYNVYGLGAVFTRREYRNRGYGIQVVRAATTYILKSDADLGMLFCDESLQHFYARAGWVPVPQLQVLCGPPDDPWLNEDEVVMCVFPSKLSQSMRAKFAVYPWYVGMQHW